VAGFIVAAIKNEGTNVRRLIFLGIAVFSIIGVTLVTQVCAVLANKYMCTLIPEMSCSSTHVTFAAIALFLLHSGGGPEYKSIPDQAKEEQPMMIEEASDGTGTDDEDEEEDDDDDPHH
jgi:hypothetical protein